LLNNVYYSLQDTKTPVINGFIAVTINVVLNLILIKPMAHRGLALATSISATVESILLIYRLKKKIGSLGLIKSVKCGLKALVASMVMGIVVYFLHISLANKMGSGTLSELITLLISAGVGASIYLILIYLLKVEELDWVIKIVKDKFVRSKDK
jgi:putative peptidoglycan lipid II flippase